MSARLLWQQNQAQFNIDLLGPLGLGHFNILRTDQHTTVTNPKGQKYRAPSAESLFYRHTGIKLPISQLVYWVKGMPAPSSEYQHTYNEQHLLATLEQDGWVIQYINYQNTLNAHPQSPNKAETDAALLPSHELNKSLPNIMPRKIKLSDGSVNVTFIIKKWQSNHQAP